MDSMKILSAFCDFYLKADIQNSMIIDIYPNSTELTFPVSYSDIIDVLLPKITIEEKNHLLGYMNSLNQHKGYNFKAHVHWYSIEYKTMEQVHLFHLYSSDRSMKGLETQLTLAQLDPLSGLLHKTAIHNFINQELESPHLKNATMFMIDIDYFKNINDNFGHVFGDQVIIAVSQTLKSISKKAQVGRLGGDEFAIFLEDNLDRDGVKNIARLIRYLLDKIIINGEIFPVTATIGISQYPKDGKTFEELYNCCDKALYRGKQKGRDCHIIYNSTLHGNINSALPKTKTGNVNVLSIAGFIKMITDTLINMPSGKEAYDRIFKHICNYFNLDRITIVDEDGVNVGYEIAPFKSPIECYSMINLDEYVANFIYDNMFMMNDTMTLRVKNETLFNIYKESSVKSFIQVLLYTEDEIPVGFISYEVINERRVWQTSELNYLVIISNLIKSFFLQARKKQSN